MLELNPRLQTVAEMVDCTLKTVDVGTDHAYLPVYLFLTKKIKDVIACDIGEKPLDNARKTLKRYALEDEIRLCISDGLKNISPSEAEQVIICGMGGTLIRDILIEAPWIKKDGFRLILQPMTHSEDVRKYLYENGFEITEERYTEDSGRVYCCISAEYTCNFSETEVGFYYFGFSFNCGGIAEKYIQKQYKRLKKRRDSLQAVQRLPEEEKLMQDVLTYYERMKNS